MVWFEPITRKIDSETEHNTDEGHRRRETVQAKKPARMHCKKLELDDNTKTGMEELQEILRRKTNMI